MVERLREGTSNTSRGTLSLSSNGMHCNAKQILKISALLGDNITIVKQRWYFRHLVLPRKLFKIAQYVFGPRDGSNNFFPSFL